MNYNSQLFCVFCQFLYHANVICVMYNNILLRICCLDNTSDAHDHKKKKTKRSEEDKEKKKRKKEKKKKKEKEKEEKG